MPEYYSYIPFTEQDLEDITRALKDAKVELYYETELYDRWEKLIERLEARDTRHHGPV